MDYKFIILLVILIGIVFLIMMGFAELKEKLMKNLELADVTCAHTKDLEARVQKGFEKELGNATRKISQINSENIINIRRMIEYGGQIIEQSSNNFSESDSAYRSKNAVGGCYGKRKMMPLSDTANDHNTNDIREHNHNTRQEEQVRNNNENGLENFNIKYTNVNPSSTTTSLSNKQKQPIQTTVTATIVAPQTTIVSNIVSDDSSQASLHDATDKPVVCHNIQSKVTDNNDANNSDSDSSSSSDTDDSDIDLIDAIHDKKLNINIDSDNDSHDNDNHDNDSHDNDSHDNDSHDNDSHDNDSHDDNCDMESDHASCDKKKKKTEDCPKKLKYKTVKPANDSDSSDSGNNNILDDVSADNLINSVDDNDSDNDNDRIILKNNDVLKNNDAKSSATPITVSSSKRNVVITTNVAQKSTPKVVPKAIPKPATKAITKAITKQAVPQQDTASMQTSDMIVTTTLNDESTYTPDQLRKIAVRLSLPTRYNDDRGGWKNYTKKQLYANIKKHLDEKAHLKH